MEDSRSRSDSRDRARIAAAEDYEIDYLVVKSGITREQARALVRRHGHDRKTLMKHARNLVIGTGTRLPFSKPKGP
jgi:Protein of unknown function (DUF3606)